MSNPQTKGELMLFEMKEFGSFNKKTQRYIRLSLDVAFERGDPVNRWGRNDVECFNIRNHQHNYRLLFNRINSRLTHAGKGVKIDQIEHVVGPLIALATFDLQSGCLGSFPPFRFLYERLFGSIVRPWLPSIYVAAAAMPLLTPTHRQSQLQSISQGACCAEAWDDRDPEFFPEWVDKVEPAPPALPSPTSESSGS